MNKIVKQVLLFYLVITLLKIVLNSLILAPSAFSDDYVYIKFARSFFFDFDFSIHGIGISIFPPLYPILLSISYAFKDMTITYFFMKVINSFVSSLIIFPVFFLARKLLSEKKSLIIAILVSLTPYHFSLSPYVMSENLFYPLFLFTIYFMYMSYEKQGYLYPLLAGIFMGFSFLTRTLGISLVAILIISSFILILLNKSNFKNIFKKTIVILVFFSLVISPWLIRNIGIHGSLFEGLLGGYTKEAKSIVTNLPFFNYVVRFVLYLPFVILSSLIIFPLKSLDIINKKNKIFSVLFLVSSFVALVIAANHGARGSINFFEFLKGRYIGRYIAYILPLIFIAGFAGIVKNKITKKITVIIFGILMALGSFLTLHALFPLNNLSLSWIGVLKYVFEFIFYSKTSIAINYFPGSLIFFALLFVGLLAFVLFLEKKKLLGKAIPYVFIFVILISFLNYAIIYQDSKNNYYDKEHMQIGLWLNDYDSDRVSNVLFDQESCGDLLKFNQEGICGGRNNTKSVIGYWLNEDITVGDVSDYKNYDYVISKRELDLSLIKRSENIYVYEVD